MPGTTYGDDWYDYKIYNETVLIPAKQRAAKWEKEEAIRAKQRAKICRSTHKSMAKRWQKRLSMAE